MPAENDHLNPLGLPVQLTTPQRRVDMNDKEWRLLMLLMLSGIGPAGEDGETLGTMLANLQSAKNASVVVPDDDNDLTHESRAILCTADGTAKVDFAESGTAVPLTLISGETYPFCIKKVYATDTTASLVALW